MRVVALGASNLTRGLATLVATARARWGREVEILAALGHGRSYGAESRFLARSLPGILDSGLWAELDSAPPAQTRALVTDVGNDILYGASATRTLAWVEECVRRLQRRTDDVVLTDLPLASIRPVSRSRFLFFRTLFVPGCRLPLAEVKQRAERVSSGLAGLAAARGLRLVRPRPEWYGADPIHIRRRLRRAAWSEILGGEQQDAEPRGPSLAETIQIRLMRPESRRLFGIERRCRQDGRHLRLGGSVKLY